MDRTNFLLSTPVFPPKQTHQPVLFPAFLKRFSLLLLSVFVVGAAVAQPSFGIKAGLNIANIRKSGIYNFNPSSLVTFKIGGMVDLPVGESFAVQPGLFVNSKGFKEANNFQKLTTNPIYFEIPLLMLGKFDLGDVRAFAGAGPYFGFGFAGKRQVNNGSGIQAINIQYGNAPGAYFKSTDIGLDFSAGVTFDSGVQLSINYGFGLSNVIPSNSIYAELGQGAQHRVLTFGLGYFFE